MDWTPRLDGHLSKSAAQSVSSCLRWWDAMVWATERMQKPIKLDAATMQDNLLHAGFSIQNMRSDRIDRREDRNFHQEDPRNSISLALRFLLTAPEICHFESLGMRLLSSLPNWDSADVRRVCDDAVAEVEKASCPLYHML